MQGLFLCFGVVGILSSMLLPLPGMLLDMLLAGNLVFALILMITALYIDQPTRLSALPTILLLATLFRLSLNISTTRLILSGSASSEVIQAFGNVVVDGSIILGLILFLVITLVQFIVIAKGAERVAEVSARFSLDALPGRQMSIDADVRSGLIDFNTASKRRAELQVESRFYGALDGAMKFVKGDAIVGIIITAINLLGGFSIGLLVLKLEPSVALHQFSLLSIGDGLLSQVPALLNSLAAGVVVTRVARDEKSSLAADIISQLGCGKRELLCVFLFVCLLVLGSSMPVMPFACVGLFFGGLSLLTRGSGRKKVDEKDSQIFEPALVPVLELRVSKALVQALGEPRNLFSIPARVQQEVYSKLGLLLQPPGIDLLVGYEDQLCYVLLVRGIAIEAQILNPEKCFASQISEYVAELVWSRPADFIDDVMIRRMLDQYEQRAPELVAGVVPALISVTQLTRLIKLLVQEGVPLHCFDVVLQALAEHAPAKIGERELLIELRIALGRVIVSRLASDSASKRLELDALDPEIDLVLSRVETERVEIPPEVMLSVVEQASKMQSRAFICTRHARRLLFEILNEHGHKTKVLAFEEVPADQKLHIRGSFQDGIDRENPDFEAMAA